MVLLAVIISLLGAYLYLGYTVPQYTATTTILVKDEQKRRNSLWISRFFDLGLEWKGNLENEIEILKSRSLAEITVKKIKPKC
jgi:uncharacterized protein involved in exopolysaccharide biosynthesis